MKKLSVLLFALVFGLAGINGTAHADSWSLTPSGQVNTTGVPAGTPVNVNLYFNYTGGMSAYFVNMDLDFSIDLTEATPKLNKAGNPDVSWAFAGQATIATQIVGNTVSYAAGNLGGYNTWAMGSNLVATIPLLTVGSAQIWDYAGDFDLLSQIGTGSKGIFDYYGNINQYGGAAGPDYGRVPIPSTLLLFGSFLFGLLVLNQKLRH